MRFFSGLLLAFSVLTSQILAASSPRGLNSIVTRDGNSSWLLPVPTIDPWYKPPTGWETASPGKALKTRYSPYRNISIGECIDTFQVLYRTTDTNNNASWAVTTVFIPASHAGCSAEHPEKCSRGIVTYAVPYDSVYKDATPSYLLQYGEPYGEIYELLRKGWFVNTPDYEGPLASYCAGVQGGHATLDSMIALNEVGHNWGLPNNTRQAIWGYSGGAMSAEFSAELAGKYSPDLKIAGIVIGGLIPNVTSAGNKMTSKDTAGLAVAGILGITSQHPVARDYINSRLKKDGPFNITGFYRAEYMTGSDVLTGFENQNVYDYFLNGSADLSVDILNQLYFDDATMGHHGTPNMPVFIYKAIADEMSAAAETDKLVEQFCKDGANILYHRNRVGGHNQELWQGRDRVLAYLSAVLEDTDWIEFPKTGCSILNVTDAVNVTLVDKMVLEGTVMKNYSEIYVYPINVTVFANGSVLVPLGNGSYMEIDPSPTRRWMGALDLLKRWVKAWTGVESRAETKRGLAHAEKKLDVLGALEWSSKSWFTTLDAGIYERR